MEKMMSLFSLKEFRAILSIPLSLHVCHNHLLWKWDKRGRYSVKSGYHVAWHLLRGTGEEVIGDWLEKLWKLEVSLKDKNFMWQALRNILPTKERIRRGVEVELVCPWCGEEEDLNHVCCKARGVWRQEGIKWKMPHAIKS